MLILISAILPGAELFSKSAETCPKIYIFFSIPNVQVPAETRLNVNSAD